MPREITLVLQRSDGTLVGALAPFRVEVPWWPEVADVVEAASRERGADVTVLRLLHARRDEHDPSGMAGAVTYVAELHGPAPDDLRAVEPVTASAALDDQPLRLPFARPRGPARELAWALDALAARDRRPSGRPVQIRTCNLSSIWSIPTVDGPVWLKTVPPHFAHEGAIIEWLADPALPPLLARGDRRVLLDDIAGADYYDAPIEILERAVETLVGIQHRVAGRLDELFALGLPDWRWPALRVRIDDVVARHADELEPAERSAIDRLLAGFDARCAAIDECGLPATLVHGDFHPGNLRGDGSRLVLLDWGDCGVGHPLLDAPAMLERLDTDGRSAVLQHWIAAWRARCPASDPARAAALIEPVAALRQAALYRGFLDAIEPSEHCYHADDPRRWLRRSARFSGGG